MYKVYIFSPVNTCSTVRNTRWNRITFNMSPHTSHHPHTLMSSATTHILWVIISLVFLVVPSLAPSSLDPWVPSLGPLEAASQLQRHKLQQFQGTAIFFKCYLLNWSYFLKCISAYNTIQALFPWLTRDLFPKFPIFFYKYNEYEIIYLASYP